MELNKVLKMTYKHFFRLFNSLSSMENENKASLRFCIIPTRMAKINKQ